MYSKLIVYFFSGTGNSRNVGFWLSAEAKRMNMDVTLVNIAGTGSLRMEEVPDKNALIAFVSPVHGFNYPPVMQSFIRRFPKGNNHVLLLNTRAGMLIGKRITPGLSGITFYLSAATLKMKGYHIRAMLPVDLPSNWISIHPGLNKRTTDYLHERNKEKVTSFAKRILNGQTDFRSVREIVQDTLIAPISIGYFIIGRFLFTKTYIASSKCTNCGSCIEQCPVKAIKTVDKRPFWTFKCENCMHCMSYCPQKAIETAHGSIIAFSLIFSLIIWTMMEKYVGEYLLLNNKWINFIVQSAMYIGILAIWYRITHFLMRFRFFERIIVSTSLTHYKFWGPRYKAKKDSVGEV